jgi:hypothetical protein
MTNATPSSDETPAVDRAETAEGHPHTHDVEFTDDETLVANEVIGGAAEFGESPDVETHDYEEPRTF